MIILKCISSYDIFNYIFNSGQFLQIYGIVFFNKTLQITKYYKLL